MDYFIKRLSDMLFNGSDYGMLLSIIILVSIVKIVKYITDMVKGIFYLILNSKNITNGIKNKNLSTNKLEKDKKDK